MAGLPQTTDESLIVAWIQNKAVVFHVPTVPIFSYLPYSERKEGERRISLPPLALASLDGETTVSW